MHDYRVFISGLFVLATLNISSAGDNDQFGGGPKTSDPPTTFAALPSQSGPVAKSLTNLSGLTREEIQAQIAIEQRKLDNLKKLLNAQASASPSSDKQGTAKKTPKPSQSTTGDTARFQNLYLREHPYQDEAIATPSKPAKPDPCNPQRLFIRADSLDNYLYGITPASKAKGASISYTDDNLAKTKTATINGMVSYVLLRDLCPQTPPGDAPFFSGYSIAPFVLGQGDYTEPRLKTESSSLKFGVENEFEISRGLLPRQVFTLAPYAQTDYRGIARVYGLNGYWQPYDANLHLGGYIDTNQYLGWFLMLRGETDVREVNAIGLTNLTNRDYAWVGGTAQLNMYFLPSATSVPDVIRNRFSLITSANYFTDTRSGMNVHLYKVALAYKITSDGSSSISLEYDNGTDKDTLVTTNKYLASLTYAY